MRREKDTERGTRQMLMCSQLRRSKLPTGMQHDEAHHASGFGRWVCMDVLVDIERPTSVNLNCENEHFTLIWSIAIFILVTSIFVPT